MPGAAAGHCENSDVSFVVRSVAVAMIDCPAYDVIRNRNSSITAFPFGPVETPKFPTYLLACPAVLPAYRSIRNDRFAALFSPPRTTSAPSGVEFATVSTGKFCREFAPPSPSPGSFAVGPSPPRSIPIPALVTDLTGITNEMVAGHRIDIASVQAFVADANIVIAHNAGFDRKFAERLSPVFEHKHWACTQTEIDWRKHGFGGAKLGYLLADIGHFHNAHRAIDDCHALVEILAHPLPTTARFVFSELIDCARRTTVRIWAQGSPFNLKEALKARGYRWNDGTDSRPKSWFIDVDENGRDAELSYLKKEIYQREVYIECRAMTALERFSNRA